MWAGDRPYKSRKTSCCTLNRYSNSRRSSGLNMTWLYLVLRRNVATLSKYSRQRAVGTDPLNRSSKFRCSPASRLCSRHRAAARSESAMNTIALVEVIRRSRKHATMRSVVGLSRPKSSALTMSISGTGLLELDVCSHGTGILDQTEQSSRSWNRPVIRLGIAGEKVDLARVGLGKGRQRTRLLTKKFVKEEVIAIQPLPDEGQDEQRRGEQIRVEMDENRSPARHLFDSISNVRQRVREHTFHKTDARVVDMGCLSVARERPRR